MWQQFLVQPGIRLASGGRPTVFNFPTPARQTWTLEERRSELERWYVFMHEPRWTDELEPSLSARCPAATDRLRRRLRRLEPLAESARTRPLAGKVPRRLATELWKHEVARLVQRPSSGPQVL